MKNLKKVGAVALAAVMAVTFAPVASLNAFANDFSGTDLGAATGTEITESNTYKLTADHTGTMVVKSGNVTINLNGNDWTGNLTINSGATVTIYDDASAPYGTFNPGTLTNNGALSYSGDFILGANSDWDKATTSETTNTTLKVGANPVAKVGGTVTMGTAAIQSGVDAAAAGSTFKAENGNVVIKNLKAGDKAYIDEAGNPSGTATITATASDGLGLAQVVTKYWYDYTATYDTTGADVEHDLTVGQTYTDVYFEGLDTDATPAYSWAPATRTLPTASTDGTTGSTTFGTLNVNAVKQAYVAAGAKLNAGTPGATINLYGFKYDRAVTLTCPPKKPFNKIQVETSATTRYSAKTAARKSKDSEGMTYLTVNPLQYETVDAAAEAYGVACIDGSKYVVDDGNDQLKNATPYATTSVNVLRGTGFVKATSNNASLNVFTLSDPSVTVSAPADESIAIEKVVDNATGKLDYSGDTATTAAVFGKDVVAGTLKTAWQDTAVVNNTTVKADLIIQQVAAGGISSAISTKTFQPRETITVPSGYAYYVQLDPANPVTVASTPKTGLFVGKIADITKDFKDKADGYTAENGVKIARSWTQGTYFASKDIVTTLTNAAPAVKYIGEVSSAITSPADAENYTWTINGGDVNTPQNVYRLRAKVGNNHLYTMDYTEANNAVASGNWVLESAEAFKMLPSNTTRADAVKVLRFRNVKTNEFLFSTDPAEQAAKLADPEWAEGYVAFCGVKDNTTGYPVTRLFSTIGQGHLYSTAQAEVKSAVEKDHYVKDGVVFFALETPEKEK